MKQFYERYCHDEKFPAALREMHPGIGEQLTDLLAPLALNWKARREKELALMADLMPLLHKLAQGREISGLGAYE